MRLLLVLLVLSVLLFGVGCHAIALQGQALERAFRRAGLTRSVEPVGDATLHYYASPPSAASPPSIASPSPAPRTVLLIHGFGAEAVWQWAPQVRALRRAGHRVIVPNLLWFGQSTSPRRDFSLDHQLTTLLALLDQLDAATVDVVGISYGGLVAYGLAGVAPGRVGKLVILDSPGAVYTDADYAALLVRFGVSHPGPLLVPEHPAGVQALVDLAFFRPPLLVRPLRRQILTQLYATDREEKVALLTDMVARMAELRARAWTISAPTLVLWGALDPVFPLEIGQRLLASLPPSARLEVIPQARHAPHLEHPALVNRLLLDFLAE